MADPPDAVAATATRPVDRVVSVLDRVVPVVRGIGTGALVLAVGSAAAVALVLLAALVEGLGTPLPWWGDALSWLLLAALLLVPAFALLVTRWLVNGLVELPDKLRREPDLRREQVEQLTTLARGGTPAGVVPLTGGKLSRSWKAGRLLSSARGDLLAYTSLFRLLRVSFFLWALLAAAVALVELVLLPLLAAAILVF
ncbi:MAG: hypothetical protein MUF83_07895 [Acidimicrobiales bacterium]|nr:hypothetical protein [Acidimicrobiales bacterium]